MEKNIQAGTYAILYCITRDLLPGCYFNILQPDRKYARRERSRIFPDLPLMENLPKYVQKSKNIGRNKTMKIFRKWVRECRI